MAVGDVDCGVVHRAGEGFEVGQDAIREVEQLAFIDVGRGAVHGIEHPIGDDRGSGDGEEVSTERQRHGRISVFTLSSRGNRGLEALFWDGQRALICELCNRAKPVVIVTS